MALRDYHRDWYPDELDGELLAPTPAPGKLPATARLAPPPGAATAPFDAAAAWASLGRPAARDADGVAADAAAAVDRAATMVGSPLPESLRGRFEQSLGRDLGGVRVHTGDAAAEAAAAVGARAFTVGSDIHFGAGNYDPEGAEGVHLLAHEVAHTVQQSSQVPVRQDKPQVSSPGDGAEIEADAAADAMVRGEPATIVAAPSPAIHRMPEPRPPDLPKPPPVERMPLEVMIPAYPWHSMIVPVPGEVAGEFGLAPTMKHQYRDNPTAATWFSAYQQSWHQGQAAWNRAAGLRQDYNNARDRALELGITGPAGANHAEGVVNQPSSTAPEGRGNNLGQIVQEGTPTGSASGVKIGDLYDENHKLGVDGKKAVGDKPNEQMDKLINEYNSKTLNDLENSVRGADNANTVAKQAARAAESALGLVTIAELKREQGENAQDLQRVVGQRDAVLGAIKAGASVLKVFEKYAATRLPAVGGGPEGAKDKAAAGAGFFGAAEDVVSYIVSQSYQADIRDIQSKINSAQSFIDNIGVDVARNGLKTAKENIDTALNQAATAQTAVITAEQARRDKLKEIAAAAATMAKGNNASPEEIERLDAAIRALPAVEMVAARLRQAAAAATIPGYSEASGRGASLSQGSPHYFVAKLSILAGMKKKCTADAEIWDQRAQQIRDLITGLHSTLRR